MLAEVYRCDRKGCKSETPATGRGDFFYTDPSWMGIMIHTEHPQPGDPERKRYDFCSYECLGLWVDEKIGQRRDGK